MKDAIKWCRMEWSKTQIWNNYEIKPSPGVKRSFLREVTFDKDAKDNRNSPEEEEKGNLRQSSGYFTGKLAGSRELENFASKRLVEQARTTFKQQIKKITTLKINCSWTKGQLNGSFIMQIKLRLEGAGVKLMVREMSCLQLFRKMFCSMSFPRFWPQLWSSSISQSLQMEFMVPHSHHFVYEFCLLLEVNQSSLQQNTPPSSVHMNIPGRVEYISLFPILKYRKKKKKKKPEPLLCL